MMPTHKNNKSFRPKSVRKRRIIKESNSNDNNNFNKSITINFGIKILVNLYDMEKKIESSFQKLGKIDKSQLYLIDKTFIENFKKHFNYEYVQFYLEHYDSLNDILINDIISRLSQDKNIVNENNNKIRIIPHKYKYFVKNTKNKCFKFLIDYEIINDKLYNLFNKSNYIKDNMKKVNVYKINDNKILVKFNSENIYGQLGYIGQNYIFIPEYYLDFKQSNIQYKKFRFL